MFRQNGKALLYIVVAADALGHQIVRFNKCITVFPLHAMSSDQCDGKNALQKALLNLRDGKNNVVEFLLEISERMGDIKEFVNAAFTDSYYKGKLVMMTMYALAFKICRTLSLSFCKSFFQSVLVPPIASDTV